MAAPLAWSSAGRLPAASSSARAHPASHPIPRWQAESSGQRLARRQAAALGPPLRRRRNASARVEASGAGGQPYGPEDGQEQGQQASGSGQPSPAGELAPRPDLNQLQTALNTAIAAEDWELAARIRDTLRILTGQAGEQGGARLASDWRALGVLSWLADRAENIGFSFPTEVQKRAAPVILDGDDCIIQSETGSGKTLAFLLPLLCRLAYPPIVYPDDLKGPQAVIVVPTMELGVQVVMLIYRLFGGSVNQGVPGQGGNMFDYNGPRGLKVKGLLLDSEVEAAKKENYLKGAHVVVGTPDRIAEAMIEPDGIEVVQHVFAVAVDEVDACFQSHPEEMELIMAAACQRSQQAQQGWQQQQQHGEQQQQGEEEDGPEGKPLMVLVGATLEEPLIEHLVQQGWVSDPVTVRVGDRMRIPSGLQHRCIVVDETNKAAAMCRQIRADLRGQSPDEAPARVMVFAGSEEQARQLAGPLRTVLWGDHKISVLLPEGAEPIKALHSFRDNKTTLLLATPAAARGLDLPAVSHVYNLELPSSSTDYLHRAGRAGRIGSTVQGVVTTMVTEADLPALQTMASELGIQILLQGPPPPEPSGTEGEGPEGLEVRDLESARRGLEDLFNLY